MLTTKGKLFDVDDDLYIGPEDVIEEEMSSREEKERLSTRCLNRTLSWMDGFCIVVGIIIGSGIFSSPGVALARAGSSVGLVLLSWTFSGTHSLTQS